ncbi:MAG: SUMF1/EgtB/PvdO family nonheme iron enzyme [Phycisphaerales bacterium]|nr:MAG: SUMF1/EgtB/PvdO family nonheme iron enzyme [Phycisphaerales bacterium]
MENWSDEAGMDRCLRGGSWIDSNDILRCSDPNSGNPVLRSSYAGFRVVFSQS